MSFKKKYINAAFIAAFIILTAANIFVYFNIRVHFDDQAVINEVLNKVQLSESLLSNITEAETSRRGYLITGDAIFINQYGLSYKSIDSLYKKLKNTVYEERSKEIIDTLGNLLFLRTELLSRSDELQQIKDKEPKLQIDYINLSGQTMKNVSHLISRFQDAERENIKHRVDQADLSASRAMFYVPLVSLFAYTLLFVSLIILNKNISKRKKIEKSLTESRNWFETTLKTINDGVIVTNNIGYIVFINNAAEHLTGWKEFEANGVLLEHIFNLVDEVGGEKITDINKIVFDNNKSGNEFRTILLRNKSNSLIPIEFSVSGLTLQENEAFGMVYVFRDISQRRKAENELLDSKKFIQRIADSIPSVIYIYSINGLRINYVNYKILDLLGFSADYIKGLGEGFFTKLIHPDDRTKLLSLFQRFVNAKDSEILDYEYRIKNSQGLWRNFRNYDVVFSRFDDGTVNEMLGTAMDVTDRIELEEEIKKYSGHLEELVNVRTDELQKANRKLQNEVIERVKAENSIIEAEEKFRNLVENSLAGIYIIQDFNFVYVNPKFEELFGFNNGELLGTSSLDRVHSDYREMVKNNMLLRLNNEVQTVQYEFKGIKKDGSCIDVEVRGTKMLYNKKESIIGTLLDITERKKFESAVIEQQQFLNTVIDADPSFIFAKDWNGRFTLVNKAVADNYATNVGDLVGKTDSDFNSNPEEVEHFMKDDREVITSRKPKLISEEVVTNTKTGESKWYQTIKVPLFTKGDEVQVLGVSTDITARKLAEETIKKSLMEKELLLKEIHHRVKNNLQIIISLLKLQANYMHDSRDLELFVNSRARVETLSMIHEKLYKRSDLSNIDIGNYLSDLSNNILKTVRNKYDGIKLEINSENILLGIETAIPCGLILNELLLAIIKHSFTNGDGYNIKIEILKRDGKIWLSVRDNGKGIEPILNLGSPDSLSNQLIDMLVKQIEGEVKISNVNGTYFELAFKEIAYKERI